MANALYDAARESFLRGEISWNNDDIKVALIDTNDYAVTLSTHDFLNDVPGAAIVATSGNLASKTTTAGTADAADVTLSTVTGDPSEALIIYRDNNGTAASSNLIAYIDTATGLPITPNGADITIQWDSGSNRIFTL